MKCAIKSELKHNSSDEECVADTNIDADGLGMAELDDTTSFDTFDEEEQLEQAVENADALPDNEKPDAPAISNKMHELNGAQVCELMKIILEMRKKHPGWIAVEVQSADGSEVLIKF